MYFAEIVNTVIVSVKTIYFYVQYILYIYNSLSIKKQQHALTNKYVISSCSPIIFYWFHFTHQRPISKQHTRRHSLQQGIAIIGFVSQINIFISAQKNKQFRIMKDH